jgi:hypothetical protein
MNIFKSEDTTRGGGGREMPIELLRSWQLPVHRSQWKFIFLIGHISFRVRLDSMVKLIRNYINPNGFAVYDVPYPPCRINKCCFLWLIIAEGSLSKPAPSQGGGLPSFNMGVDDQCLTVSEVGKQHKFLCWV